MADLDDIARKKQAAEEDRKRKQRAEANEKRAQKALEDARKTDERATQQALATAHSKINAAEARAQRALNEKLKGANALEEINRILSKPGIRTTKSLSREQAQKVTSRPQGKDGAVSFHFSVTSVTKAGELASALRGKKSAAAALSSAQPHQKYIERDDAAEKVEVVKVVPDIADPAQIEIIQDTIVSSFGNISDDPVERDRFWQLVDENESNPSLPQVCLDARVDLPLFQQVQDLAAQEDHVFLVLDHAIATQQPVHETMSHKDALGLTRLFQKAGHQPVEIDPSAGSTPPIAFKLGNGGRTQIRLVVELPHELTPIQRMELAQEFTSRYDDDGLKYWAVIHAPNKHNDERNYHLHVNLYDRPCGQMTDTDTRQVYWTFERKLTSYKNTRTKRLVARDIRKKLVDYTARGWVKGERQRFSKIANAHLTKAGVVKRLDPRRYEEMGVMDKARTRVPPAAYARERKGEPTAVGIDFANDQWAINRKAVEQIARSDQSYEAWRRAWLRQETRPQIGRSTSEAIKAIKSATQVAKLSAEKTALVTERNALNHVAAKIESRARLKPEKKRDDADKAALAVADEIKADVLNTDRKIGLTLMKIAKAERAYITAKRRDDQAINEERKRKTVMWMRAIARAALLEFDGPDITEVSAEGTIIQEPPAAAAAAPEKATDPARNEELPVIIRDDGKIEMPEFDAEDHNCRAQRLKESIRRHFEAQREERKRLAASVPPEIVIPKPAPASVKPKALREGAPEGTPIAANPVMPGRKVETAAQKVPINANQTAVPKPKNDPPEELEKDGLSKENIAKLLAIQERIRQAKGRSR